LRDVHGATYVDYSNRVGRFLPGLGCEIGAER
jgi:hypothetical protein